MIDIERIFKEQDFLNKETAAKHEEYSKLTRDELTRNYCFSALSELGECSNEWAGFKIWKSTRKENRDAPCKKCNGSAILNELECPYCEEGRTNPLREEYIDVFHFVVSVAIGFDADIETIKKVLAVLEKEDVGKSDSYQLFLDLYTSLARANGLIDDNVDSYTSYADDRIEDFEDKETLIKVRQTHALELIEILVRLGYALDFSNDEIEAAYFSKHKINQVRQENNY